MFIVLNTNHASTFVLLSSILVSLQDHTTYYTLHSLYIRAHTHTKYRIYIIFSILIIIVI